MEKESPNCERITSISSYFSLFSLSGVGCRLNTPKCHVVLMPSDTLSGVINDEFSEKERMKKRRNYHGNKNDNGVAVRDICHEMLYYEERRNELELGRRDLLKMILLIMVRRV